MKITKSQSGFTAVHAMLFLVIIGIISFTGWKVYSTGQASKTAESSTPTSAVKKDQSKPASTIPDGFIEYQNKELGFKFAYPKEWGEASFQSGGRDGYSKFSYNVPTDPDGVPSKSIVFSKSNVTIGSNSTKYRYGPKGGTFLTIATGYCVINGKYYLEHQNNKNNPNGYEAYGVKCTKDFELVSVEVMSSSSI